MGSVLASLYRSLTTADDRPDQPQNGQYPSHQQPEPQYPALHRPSAPYPIYQQPEPRYPAPHRPSASYPSYQQPAPQYPAPYRPSARRSSYQQLGPRYPAPQRAPAQSPSSSPASQQPHNILHPTDANQRNQDDPGYIELRAQANREGDQMARCIGESRRAFANRDGARAKQLSNEGRRHKAEMNRINTHASNWIFYQNNKDRAPHELDLHGLYVTEAIKKTEQAIAKAQKQGRNHLNIIVGRGLHSQGHVAKVKPAIENLMRKYNLAAYLDPHNEGVLIVLLKGGDRYELLGMGDYDWNIEPSDITNRLGNDGEDCVIM